MSRILYPIWMNSMPECDGCGQCCGPVAITHDEYWAIKDYCSAKGIVWANRGLFVCGFLDEDNRCRIYEARPLLCRMYGITKELPCPHHPDAVRGLFPPEESCRHGLGGFDALPLESVSWEQVPATFGAGVRVRG